MYSGVQCTPVFSALLSSLGSGLSQVSLQLGPLLYLRDRDPYPVTIGDLSARFTLRMYNRSGGNDRKQMTENKNRASYFIFYIAYISDITNLKDPL